MTSPRVYVEAAERFADDAGYRKSFAGQKRLQCNGKVLFLEPTAFSSSHVIPVTSGTISLADALRLLRGAG